MPISVSTQKEKTLQMSKYSSTDLEFFKARRDPVNRYKGKQKRYDLISIYKPLVFGMYKGYSIAEIMEIDRSYVAELIRSDDFILSEQQINKLIALFDEPDTPREVHKKKLATYPVQDEAGNFIGYFVFSQDEKTHSEPLLETNFEFTLSLGPQDHIAKASNIQRRHDG